MQQVPSFAFCPDHPESPLQLLVLSKKGVSKRLLCVDCAESVNYADWKDIQIITIPLGQVIIIQREALQSPGKMIDKMKKDSDSKQLKDLFSICELDLEKEFNDWIVKFELLTNIFNHMKEQITQKLNEYLEIQQKLKQMRESFLEVEILIQQKCNCNILKQQIDQLKQLNNQFKTDQYQSVMAQINSTIEEMLKDNCALITKNTDEILKSHFETKLRLLKPNNSQFINQISQVFSGYSQFIEDLNDIINARVPRLLSYEFYKTIQRKIEQGSNKYVKSLNQIYLGSRDGLNGNAFWSKVNRKGNLLIILKSQINQIFGGYTPCQWNQDLYNYIQDDTLSSFLFSQTRNQIYPLNQAYKQYAIWSGIRHGPIFGEGEQHDMCINDDFISGRSGLGRTYVLDQTYKNQANTHLFGEPSTKIIECEIYEIILQ